MKIGEEREKKEKEKITRAKLEIIRSHVLCSHGRDVKVI
jgi:hypothetical protein